MATIQQSIEVKVPVHTAFDQLTRFEDYPCFMEEVEAVQRLDDTHLHWTTRMANRPVEWDAEITEREPDRCIAWHNISGPTNTGKIELQPAGPDSARITFTLRSEPQQVPGSMAGNHEGEMAQRLQEDMARLKDFIEARGSASWASLSEVDGAPASGGIDDPQQGRGSPRNSPVPMESYAANPPVRQPAERPGAAPEPGHPKPADTVHPGGATDAAAGAHMAGSGKGAAGSTGIPHDAASPAGSTAGGASPAAGAAAAGGTGLGGAEIGADASDTRVTPRESTAGGAAGTAGTGQGGKP